MGVDGSTEVSSLPEHTPKIVQSAASELPDGVTLTIEYEIEDGRLETISAVLTNVAGDALTHVYDLFLEKNVDGEWVDLLGSASWTDGPPSSLAQGESWAFTVVNADFDVNDRDNFSRQLVNRLYVNELLPGMYRIMPAPISKWIIGEVEPVWVSEIYVEFMIVE